MENSFRPAADRVERYLRDGIVNTQDSAEIAIVHLVARSLEDLRAAQFLAGEGRTIQMHSVARPVVESLNLVELFVQQPELADQWAAGHHQEFRPARVRELLGEGPDELYGYMSEHSHPRFAAFQLSILQRVAEPGDQGRRAVLFLGGLPFQLPPVLIGSTIPGLLLIRLAHQGLGHCRVREQIALTWPTVLREVIEGLLPGFERVHTVAQEAWGDEAADEVAMVGELQHLVEHAQELEALVAEYTGQQDEGGAGQEP